jgi:hypothetical protein
MRDRKTKHELNARLTELDKRQRSIIRDEMVRFRAQQSEFIDDHERRLRKLEGRSEEAWECPEHGKFLHRSQAAAHDGFCHNKLLPPDFETETVVAQ